MSSLSGKVVIPIWETCHSIEMTPFPLLNDKFPDSRWQLSFVTNDNFPLPQRKTFLGGEWQLSLTVNNNLKHGGRWRNLRLNDFGWLAFWPYLPLDDVKSWQKTRCSVSNQNTGIASYVSLCRYAITLVIRTLNLQWKCNGCDGSVTIVTNTWRYFLESSRHKLLIYCTLRQKVTIVTIFCANLTYFYRTPITKYKIHDLCCNQLRNVACFLCIIKNHWLT